MRTIVLTLLGVTLISASTLQFAGAAEHHHGRKAHSAAATQQFRNANDSLVTPLAAPDYSGHGLSAPAGRS
jgi:hypothetical protein